MALQVPANEACQEVSPKKTLLLTPGADCSGTATSPPLFRRRLRNVRQFASQSAPGIQGFSCVVGGAQLSKMQYSPKGTTLRGNNLRKNDMIAALPRPHPTYGTCGHDGEALLQHVEQPRSGMMNLPFAAGCTAPSDGTCTAPQAEAKRSDSQRVRQQNNGVRSVKEENTSGMRHSRGRDEQDGTVDMTTEGTLTCSLSPTREKVTAWGKDWETQTRAAIARTPAVKAASKGEAPHAGLQLKQEQEPLEQADAQEESSKMQYVAGEDKTQGSESTVLESREMLANTAARNIEATQNLIEAIRRIQAENFSKCPRCGKSITDANRTDAIEQTLKVLGASRSPGIKVCSVTDVSMNTPTNTLDHCGEAVSLRENTVPENENHFAIVEGRFYGEGATSSVHECFAPSSTPSTHTRKQASAASCTLPEAALCLLCRNAEQSASKASCPYVTSTRKLTGAPEAEACISLPPGSLSIGRKGIDGREEGKLRFSWRRELHAGASGRTEGTPIAASISDRAALLKPEAGDTTEKAEHGNRLRDKDGVRKWCTSPFMPLTQTTTATEVTPAIAVSASGGSSPQSPPVAPLHALGRRKSCSLLCTGSSRQSCARNTTDLGRTAAISRGTTVCDRSNEWLPANECRAMSPVRESILCCCCDCCSSSIVVTTASEPSPDQTLLALYPVPPPPRKFCDNRGNPVSGKPGWYGHNYPSFRSTRIQQCGLLYLRWRRGHLRIGSVVLLFLHEAVKRVLFIITRMASSPSHTVRDPAHSRVPQKQDTTDSSTHQLTMSADSLMQAETRLLDHLVGSDEAQRQQQLPHVCVLPYCKITTALQCNAVCHCNVSLNKRMEEARYTPVERNHSYYFKPEEFHKLYHVGKAAREARRRESSSRLSSGCESFQFLERNNTGRAQRESRWSMTKKDRNAVLCSSELLKLIARKTSHVEQKDGEGALQVGSELYAEEADRSGLLVNNRSKGRTADSRRSMHKMRQEAAAVADIFAKEFYLPGWSFPSSGSVRHAVQHKKGDNAHVPQGRTEGSSYRGKVKQREGGDKVLSGFRIRQRIREIFVPPVLGLLVPAWLHLPVNSLSQQLIKHLALLPRKGLLRRRVGPLMQLLRRLLLELPKEVLWYLMPTYVADIFKMMVKEWENLDVPDSEARRRLAFIVLLLVMYPFVHGFYIPCVALLWLLRRVYDIFWCFYATVGCSYCTSKQRLRRWQDEVYSQQHTLRQHKLQERQSFEVRGQCRPQRLEPGVATDRDDQRKRPQKMVNTQGQRVQGEQDKPAVQQFRQPRVQADGRKYWSEQQGQKQEGLSEHKEQQRQRSPQEKIKKRCAGKQCLQQQFQPHRGGWYVAWSQLLLLLGFLMDSIHRRIKQAASPLACEQPAHSNPKIAAAEKVCSQSYSLLFKPCDLLWETLNRCVISPLWNAFYLLISLPSCHTFAFHQGKTPRHSSLSLWAHTTAATGGGKAILLRLLQRTTNVAEVPTMCVSRSDACNKDETTESGVALLLLKAFSGNLMNAPLRILTSMKEMTTSGKKAGLWRMLSWTVGDRMGRRASALLKEGLSVVKRFRQGDNGRGNRSKTEILGLLNGQELVLFSQPHMVVCGVGYTEKLTREELLQVIREKLLAQRGEETATLERETRKGNYDDYGVKNQQKASEQHVRRKGETWKEERRGDGETEEEEDTTREHYDKEEQRHSQPPARKIKKEEAEETLREKRRKGSEKPRWEKDATENNDDEENSVPLLRFKHPRLRTAVRKVLNRYCWVRHENFSAARHVISLNRQQVLSILALHQGQDSPTDFSRFQQNLALQEAASKHVHSISCCHRCSREDVPKGEEIAKWSKMESLCKDRVTGRIDWKGSAEQIGEETVTGNKDSEGEEVTVSSEMHVRTVAEGAHASHSKLRLRRMKKGKTTGAGRDTGFLLDQFNCRGNRMTAHTHCSCSQCKKREEMFSSNRVSSNDCRSNTKTSEQLVEERISTPEGPVCKSCNNRETDEKDGTLSRTGRCHHSNNKTGKEATSITGVSVRSGCDRSARNEDGPAFSPRQRLASSSVSCKNNLNDDVQKDKDSGSNQVLSFPCRGDIEEREEDRFFSKDVHVSQVNSGCPPAKEKIISRKKRCRCVVRKEEAQALLTLLASQTLPPGLPLWQFVLLESVEVPTQEPPASDVSALEKDKGNTFIQKNGHGRCSTVTTSSERAAAEARYRNVRISRRRSLDGDERSVGHKENARSSSEDGKARAVQSSRRLAAARDRGAGKKRRSRIRADRNVHYGTTARGDSTPPISSLVGTWAEVKNTIGRRGISYRRPRPLGGRREERDLCAIRCTAPAEHDTGKWRKAATTPDATTSRETADSVEEDSCCVQTATSGRGKSKLTKRESNNGTNGEAATRRRRKRTGHPIFENSEGVAGLTKGRNGRPTKSEKSCIGSMVIFRVHHSVADGIALTNMFLSDVFTASPPRQQSPRPPLEQDSSSLAFSAAQRHDWSAAAVCEANDFASRKQGVKQVQQVQHSGTTDASEEGRCNTEGQERVGSMRPKMLQQELPTFTPSTTAASSPASRGQHLDAETICRCCIQSSVQSDQNPKSVRPDVGAAGSPAGSSSSALPTAPSSVTPSACAELRTAVGVVARVAGAAADSFVTSPTTPSNLENNRYVVQSICSAPRSPMTTVSLCPDAGTVPSPEALAVAFLTESHSHSSLHQTKDASCSTKSPRVHSRTETSSTEGTASHSRCCSGSVARAHSNFTAETGDKAAFVPRRLKPMVPPITPPSFLPRLLIQIVAYLRIPWEVCSLLVLRRDRSWDSVVQPRRQRAGWAHEVHSVRFDLQRLRNLRRCLSTVTAGNPKEPFQQPAAFPCTQWAPFAYAPILRVLQRAISVASKPLLCLQQQLFLSFLTQSRCADEPSLFPTSGDPPRSNGPPVSTDVAAATSSNKASGAALKRPGKPDAVASSKSVGATLHNASASGNWTAAALGYFSVLVKNTAAPIKFSVDAVEKATEVAGKFLCLCLQWKRCSNISASDSHIRGRSATMSSPREAAPGTSVSSSAAAMNSFTINELLTSCVAGGVSRYIRTMAAAEHFCEAATKTQKRGELHSSSHLKLVCQPGRASLASSSAQASGIARLLQRHLAPGQRHGKTHKIPVLSSLTYGETKLRSTMPGCFNRFPETLVIDETVSSAPRAMPSRGSSSIRRSRCRSTGSTRDYQRKQPVNCRETCRRRIRYKDTHALPAARHIATRCASRTLSPRFSNSDIRNSRSSDIKLICRKSRSYVEEATCTHGRASAKRRCMSAATFSRNISCRTAVGVESVQEDNRTSGGYAFSCSTHSEAAHHKAGRCYNNAAGRAWRRVSALGRREGDRIERGRGRASRAAARCASDSALFFTVAGTRPSFTKASPVGHLSQWKSHSGAGLEMATPGLRWYTPETRQEHDSEAVRDVEGSVLRGASPTAGVTSPHREIKVAEPRATTFRPVSLLTDVGITWKQRRCVVTDYTDKTRPAETSNCVERPVQLTATAKEHTDTRRRDTVETRDVGRPADALARTKAVKREHEYNKTRAEGLERIQQSLLDLNIVVPVNLRTTEEESFQLHNNFTSVVVQLATADLFFADTAYERLVRVRAKLRKSVRNAGASVFGLMEKICFATTPDFTWFLHMWLTNKLSMLLSNVPGPSVLPQIHGRQVYMMNFIGSLVGKVGINASAFSYQNCLDLVLHIDRAVLDAPELLRQCILDEYRELEQLCA